jgi:nucleoside-diphosphate-sugar epimerase
VALIAITGGLGFVGSALTKHLSSRFDVRILDNRVPEPSKAIDRFDFVKCDVTDYDEVKHALANADLVIHTAIIQIPAINEHRRLGYEVNVLGTQNVCEVVRENAATKGVIVTGTWHTIGEKTKGYINESFGLRPDMVESRARLYALSKVAQEAIVRLFAETTSDKTYGIIRMGTVLGENMPKGTAASTFIEKGLKGEQLTPYEHSMHRPMLYVDVMDLCRAFESLVLKILDGQLVPTVNSLESIVNVYHPVPISILDLANMVRESVIACSNGRLRPEVSIVKTDQPSLNSPNDKNMMEIDVSKAKNFLGLDRLASPREVIDRIVKSRLASRSGEQPSPRL